MLKALGRAVTVFSDLRRTQAPFSPKQKAHAEFMISDRNAGRGWQMLLFLNCANE